MAEKILMLALSPTMETGMIARWTKHEGESFSSGDVLCEVETDKATMDYESSTDGTLLKIVANDGSRVKVGDLIAVAGSPGEDISSMLTKVPKSTVKPQPEKGNGTPSKQAAEKITAQVAEEPEKASSFIKASPLAREIARQRGIDLSTITGSGPGGRIIKEDVEKTASASRERKPLAVKETTPVSSTTSIPISEKRRVIAKRLSDSMFTAPHFYMTIAVGMDRILAARKSVNERSPSKISLNAFLIKIIAEVLRRHPVMLSSWNGDSIIRYGNVDIAVAVAQKDGLITPVVRNCTAKGIKEIDQELIDLVSRARDNRLLPEEYTGATFTISNLGTYGIRQFTAIINPPASSILAIGEIFRELIVDDNDTESIRSTMMCTLSCDHRVIDGAVAAEFARDLKNCLEDPIAALF